MKVKFSNGRGYTYRLPMRIVWTTRECVPVLTDGIGTEVEIYLRKTSDMLAVDDFHVHLDPDAVTIDVSCRPQFTPADAVKVLKGNTARWLFMQHPEVKKKMPEGHLWDASYLVQYGVFGGWPDEAAGMGDKESTAYLEEIRKKAGINHGKEI